MYKNLGEMINSWIAIILLWKKQQNWKRLIWYEVDQKTWNKCDQSHPLSDKEPCNNGEYSAIQGVTVSVCTLSHTICTC